MMGDEGTGVPLDEGRVVAGRWVVRKVLNGVGDCTTYVVDELRHDGDVATLWLFEDRSRGRAEERLRRRVQSRGITAFIDSGPHGERHFICTAHHEQNLRSAAAGLWSSGASVDELHRLARQVACGVVLALGDIAAAGGDQYSPGAGRPRHGRLSPEAVLVDGQTAVLAHLGDVGDRSAHRSVGDESEPFRPPDADVSVNSEPVDVWMLGSLIHWVFTGEPAPARARVDRDERIPAGWRPFLRGSLAARPGARPSLAELEQQVPDSARVAPVEQTETWGEFGRLFREKLEPIADLVGGAVRPTTDRLATTARTAPTSAIATVLVAGLICRVLLERLLDPPGPMAIVLVAALVGFGFTMARMVVGASGLLLGQWLGVEVALNVTGVEQRFGAPTMLVAVGATLIVAWIREFHREVRDLDPNRVEEAAALGESGRSAVIGFSQQMAVMALMVGFLSTSWSTDGNSPWVWVVLSASVAAWDATGPPVRPDRVPEPGALTRAARRLSAAPIRVTSRMVGLCSTSRARSSIVIGLVLWLVAVLSFLFVFRADPAELGALVERQLAWEWLDSAPVLVAAFVPLLLLGGAATAIGLPSQPRLRPVLAGGAVLAGVLAVRAAWSSGGGAARWAIGLLVAGVAGAALVGAYERAARQESGLTTFRNVLVVLAVIGVGTWSVAWSSQFWSVPRSEDDRARSWAEAAAGAVPDVWRPVSLAAVDQLSVGPGRGSPVVGLGGLPPREFEPVRTWLLEAAGVDADLWFTAGDAAVGSVARSDDASEQAWYIALAVTVDQAAGDGGPVDLEDRVGLVFRRTGGESGSRPLGSYRTVATATSGSAVDLDVVVPTFIDDVDGDGRADLPVGPSLDLDADPRPSFVLVAEVPVEPDVELHLVAVVLGEEAFSVSARPAEGDDPRPVLDGGTVALVASTGTWTPTPGPVDPVGLDQIRVEGA